MSMWAKRAAKVFNDAFVTEDVGMSQVRRTRTGELGTSIAKWSELVDRLTGIASSSEFDREAVDATFSHLGIESGSLYDPIAMMKAIGGIGSSVTLSAYDGKSFSVNVNHKGRLHAATGRDIVVMIAECVANAELQHAVQELTNLNTNAGMAAKQSGFGLDHHQQWLQSHYRNQLMANYPLKANLLSDV